MQPHLGKVLLCAAGLLDHGTPRPTRITRLRRSSRAC